MEEEPIEVVIGRMLISRGYTFATAESCTGGRIGDRMTNIPGSSEYYLGGVVAYANTAKMALLGVSEDTLTVHGAVSRQTVLEMARGIRLQLGVDLAVSVSGIAGPGGATVGKPVGMICFGLSAPDGEWAIVRYFSGDRVGNKEMATEYALTLVQSYLLGERNFETESWKGK